MSKKLKDLLSEDITTMGGVVSRPAFSGLDMGFRTQKSTKLTNIVEDMYGDSKPKINVKEFVQEIGQYNSYGNEIYREGNLKELASKLSKLAETAKQHTLQETEDWFDKITVNRNMKELTGLSNQFKKVASEAQSLQERMGGLYEDMGHILGRYYEINGEEVQTDEVKEEFNGMVREGEYEEFFQAAMKKFGISSPDELDDEKKKEFFNYVDNNYSAKNEDNYSFAGKKYKKKSSAPVSDPRVNRDSQGTAVNPIDQKLDALRQQSRKLSAMADKAETFTQKQPLLAKRKQIQMKIKQLVRQQG